MTSLVSLVLVTYHSEALLPGFFEALAATRDVPYEVIAVDNASADGTVAALARYPGVRLVANAQNLGFGRACNEGAALARGELLVFLNPDVLATPTWLAVLSQRMAAHPDAAIITPQTALAPPARSSRRGVARSAGVREAAAVPGCAMMVRRAAWQALGGFDERIFLYWEDTELCWRAWLGGWRVLEDLEAAVVHERGGSGGGARWAAEAMKNGLYAHLKLRAWPAALRFAARQAAMTLAQAARGQGAAFAESWRWNVRGMGVALAQRRAIRSRAAPERLAHLEQLAAAHAARQRAEQRARRNTGAHYPL